MTHHLSPRSDIGSDLSRRVFLQSAGLAAAALAASAAAARAAEDNPPANDEAPAPPAELTRIQELLRGEDPITWVFTGDSITHGALHTLGWRSYPEHFAERVRWELRRVRDVAINTGISGERTGGLLADLEWRVLRFQPQVVSIMIGMNDCSAGPDGREDFRRNMIALVERVRAAGGIPLLNTPNTIYTANAASRSDLPAYADIVRAVAIEAQTPLVDHWTHWQEAKPNQDDLLPWLEDHSIHPGVYGHREFARLIFHVLGIYDAESPTCKLEAP